MKKIHMWKKMKKIGNKMKKSGLFAEPDFSLKKFRMEAFFLYVFVRILQPILL